MQRVTPDIGKVFHPVEDALREAFLPALFSGASYKIPGRAVTDLSVNQAGISLPEPTNTAGSNWTVSCVITVHPVAELRVKVEHW